MEIQIQKLESERLGLNKQVYNLSDELDYHKQTLQEV